MSAKNRADDLVGFITRAVLPAVIVIGIFVALARVAARPLSNYDTFFHLRFGEEFLRSWSLRHPGHVSSFGSAHWVPTQWLPEVVMAKAGDLMGLGAVSWLSGAQFVVLVLAMYFSARRVADPLYCAALLPFAVMAITPGLSMRPQVISYALCAVTVAAWTGARRSGRVPWLLIPMTWLWAMYHGMWPLGIVIGLAAVAGLVADRTITPRRGLAFLLVPVGSFAAGGLTPIGPALYGAVIQVTSRGSYFSEWSPPDFTTLPCLVLLALIAVPAVIQFRSGRTAWFDVAMLAVAAGFAVYSLRTVPVAAAMLVPIGAAAIQRAIGTPARPLARQDLAITVGAALSLGALALTVPHTADHPDSDLSRDDAALAKLPDGSVVMSDAGFGGYLMWRFPSLDITDHGYGDVFTDTELKRNNDITMLAEGWAESIRRMHVEYAVLPADTSLAYSLEHVAGWTMAYHSEGHEILQAPRSWTE